MHFPPAVCDFDWRPVFAAVTLTRTRPTAIEVLRERRHPHPRRNRGRRSAGGKRRLRGLAERKSSTMTTNELTYAIKVRR
jgi:hypothetical protein